MFQNLIVRTAIGVLLLDGGMFAAPRFDYQVRNDFFAGISGNQEAFARAMKTAEEVISANGEGVAEALAWHGSGLLLQAGGKFQQGDFKAGAELWEKGNIDMERAGTLEPDNVGVLIPRAATWFAASRSVPKEQQRLLIEKAIADYEHVYDIQKDIFENLHIHDKSELLFGLADGYARLENTERARTYFEKLAALGQKSGHLQQAQAFLAGGKYTVTALGCAGCHTGK